MTLERTENYVAVLNEGDVRVLVQVDEVEHGDGEREVASTPPNIDTFIEGLSAFARRVGESAQSFSASRVVMEFGCEFGLESGGLVAVLGKASATSSVSVTLEWTASPNDTQP